MREFPFLKMSENIIEIKYKMQFTEIKYEIKNKMKFIYIARIANAATITLYSKVTM